MKSDHQGAFHKTKSNWYYAENVCLNNRTHSLHIYSSNQSLVEQLQRKLSTLRIPNDIQNFRHVLSPVVHLGDIPSNYQQLDDFYILINRGWNNMYHHSEWIVQFVRYLLNSRDFPPVG